MLVRLLTQKFVNDAMSFLLQGRATIFMLHRMANPRYDIVGFEPAVLRNAIAALRDVGCSFVAVEELLRLWVQRKPLPRYSIAFTVDDGFADQADELIPILLEQRVPVTVFLITGLLDGSLWPWHDQLAWLFARAPSCTLTIATPLGPRAYVLDDYEARRNAMRDYRELCTTLPHAQVAEMVRAAADAAGLQIPLKPPPQYQPMSWGRARALHRQGVIFGAHSVSHGIISRMDDGTASYELLEAAKRVRTELGHCSPVYCWPVGRQQDFGVRDIRILQEAGFEGALASQDDYGLLGADSSAEERFRIKRFSFPSDVTDALQYATWLERGKQIVRSSFGRS